MHDVKREISRDHFDGFVLVKQLIDGSSYGSEDFEVTVALTPTGDYIGNEETARYIVGNRGIAPEKVEPLRTICSIGFCARERRWYGWSHRAICGFGIGSEVRRGDIAYVPTCWDDFKDDCIRFWTDPHHLDVKASNVAQDSVQGVYVSWTYSDTFGNEAMRGTIGGTFIAPPKQWGRGEWMAKSLDDAKQMAINYADDVA
ncbi:MAG: hypothetical protein GDA50_04080 [Alphaproteobacteria bacterium GM202ARS2]|nr:hypothetical protein [Alphaproteobacteria bacterium GM202ARS2]